MPRPQEQDLVAFLVLRFISEIVFERCKSKGWAFLRDYQHQAALRKLRSNLSRPHPTGPTTSTC